MTATVQLFDLGTNPAWLGAVALVVLGAWLASDDTAFAQTWFAQPLPASVLAGLIVGDAALGLAVGLPFQLVSLGHLPVGQTFLGDKTTPVIGAVWALTVTGSLSGGTGDIWSRGDDASLVGWMLIMLAIASITGHVIQRLERRLHLRWSADGLRCLRDGRIDRLDRVQLRCLAATCLRGAVMTVFWAWMAVVVWIPAFAMLPERLMATVAFLPVFTPVLAVGALVDLYGSRLGLRWLGGSYTLVLLVFAFFAWRGWAA